MPFDTPERCYELVVEETFEPMKHVVDKVDGYDLTKLTPCPFCNETDVEVRFDPNEKNLSDAGYKGEFKVYCKKCGAYGPGMPEYGYAVRFWSDHRQRDERLKERVNEYRRKLRKWLENIPSATAILEK